MQYLNPNSTHEIDIPVIVGSEYAIPNSDGVFIYRINGVTTTDVVPKVEATEVTVNITTPEVKAGEFKLINAQLEIKTDIGMFRTRKTFGVVDLLDIPTQGDSVREILGVTVDELNDQDIGLEGVYLDVYKLLINNFHGLRQTDDFLNKKFGDFIAIVAALRAAPQLLIRLDKKRVTENGEFQRLADAKYFEDYLGNLNLKFLEVKKDLADYLEQVEGLAVSILEVGTARQWSINR